MADHNGDRGLVLTEMMVVLAVLGIVLSLVAWSSQRGVSASAVAQELARIVVAARWSAVHEGQPRTLLVSAGSDEISAVRGAFRCDDLGPDRRVIWSAPPRTFVGWPAMGLAFAPDGRPRRCDGSGVGNTTILIEGSRGDRAAVIVASLGRVRWERR